MLDIEEIAKQTTTTNFYFLPLLEIDFIKANQYLEIAVKNGIRLKISDKCFFQIDVATYNLLDKLSERKQNYQILPMITNCFLACLYSALKTVQNYHTPIKVNINFMNRLSNEKDFNPRNIGYHANIIECFKYNAEFVLKNETLMHALTNFEKITTSTDFNCIIELNTLYQAQYYYRNHDYSNALLLGWLSLEKMLNNIYYTHKKQSKKFIKMYIVINELKKLKILDSSEYSEITDMRLLRNSWTHSQKIVTQQESYDALRIAEKFFNRFYTTDLNLQQGLNFVF